MYMSKDFAVADRQRQIDFIQNTGWGYLTGVIDGAPFVTHLPFMVGGGEGEERLIAHMARANPHWRSFDEGKPQLVVFPGPHCYISPSWYEAGKAVPTWNYATAHVYGVPQVIDDPDDVYAGQKALVDLYESRFEVPWQMETVDADFIDRMLRATVSFEIPIDRVECKFKLSQNRPLADRKRVVDALEQSGKFEDGAVAGLMREVGVFEEK